MSGSDKAPLDEPLTEREKEVLELLAQGKSNRELAEALVLSVNTVKWHNRNIYGKLGVENRQQAAERARELGLLEGYAGQPSAHAAALVTPDFLAAPGREKDTNALFLGREGALAHLEGHLRRAMSREPRAVFVSGEAGMGKTTLVREFARRATEAEPELVVALGHSSTLATGEGVYQPFRQIVDMLCGDVKEAVAAGELGREQARRLWQMMPLAAQTILQEGPNLPAVFLNGPSLLARLTSALPEGAPWLTELERVVEQAGTAPGELERSALRDQFAAVLQTLAREQPLLLIVEDLHWADRSTINLLFQLGKGVGASPLLFLATYRPEEVRRVDGQERPLLQKVLAEFRREFGDVIVDLDEIGRAEGRAFVDEMVDTRPNRLGESFRQALFTHTGGHPLFTTELLRALRQRGDLQQDQARRWRVAAEINWNRLPEKIEGVLQERLGRLPPELRELLDVAAVEGETFTAQVIAGALDLPERDVVRVLSGPLAQEHRLIQSVGTSHLGQKRFARFRFRHELFRQYLYDSLEEVRRSYLHEDVGQALETLYEGQTEDIVGQLARHFTEAGLAEKGKRYSLQAGDRARLAYAHEEAARQYENALDFLREKADPAPLARTLMKLGLTYQMALEHRRARRAFEEGFAAWQRVKGGVGHGETPPAPHPFRAPYPVEPDSLDPTRKEIVLADDIVNQLFSGLIENPGGTEPVPNLAQRWEIHDGGRTIIFHLRQDARWSDGHPLTAEDFLYAWGRLLDPDYTQGIINVELYDIKGARDYAQGEAPADALGIRALDPYSVRVELERPADQFLNLRHFPVPAHVVRRHGDEWATPKHLVGNGPFRLVRWRPRQEMVFERNPLYQGSYAGNIRRVQYTYLHEWAEAVELYDNDELDVFESNLTVASALRRLRQSYAADYVSAPYPQVVVLCFDLDREPFDDPRVRKALALAIDRETLAHVDLHGLFFPAGGGMVPPGVSGHAPDMNLAYAPQEARALLAEAGYASGRDFPNIVARAYGGGLFATIRDAVQAQWHQTLGLDIDLRPTEWGSSLDDAHLYITGAIAVQNREPSLFLDTVARALGIYGRNKAFDTLLVRARETVQPQAHLQLYRRAERLLVQEVLASPLLYGRAHYFVKPWVHGYLPPGMGMRWKDMIVEPH